MNVQKILIAIVAVLASTITAAVAQQANPAQPPLTFSGGIKTVELPAAPSGMTWNRIEEIDVAVVVPDGWKRHDKSGSFQKVFAFSDQPLDQGGFFERGLTVRLLWHPQLAAGNEARAVEATLAGAVSSIKKDKNNTVLQGTLEDKNGKRLLIVRHRNAPTGLVPIIVHTMCIGDPKTGLVYQMIYEGPEATWDENWKTGEQILKRVYVGFQAG